MNNHFYQNGNKCWQGYPREAYGRVDYVEPGVGETAIVGLDVIARDSADSMIERFSQEEWQEYWFLLFGGARRDVQREMRVAFDEAQLYHIEIVGTTRALLNYLSFDALQNQFSDWFYLRLDEFGRSVVETRVYGGLFAEGIPANLESVGPIPAGISAALNATFTMESWPHAETDEIAEVLGSVSANWLACYDVGQGLATALLKEGPPIPAMYYDIGCGVYRNAHTATPNLTLCHSEPAPILLSHWDTDHWAGARKYAPSTDRDVFLRRTWIAPFDRTVGPRHITFANDILLAGGKLLLWPPGRSALGPITLSDGRSMTLLKGTGSDRNGSGIAAIVSDSQSERAWLLTGDVDYQHLFNTPISQSFVAMTVPHHGASLRNPIQVPLPYAHQEYCRLMYSFGTRNSFGHPKSDCVAAHQMHGWSHGTWSTSRVALGIAGADVISTACNPPGTPHLGAMVAGWTNAPVLSGLPCNGRCSAVLVQN